MITHRTRSTLTLSSRNSGLMKSRRNKVSGGFSQSAIDLVGETMMRKGSVNTFFQHPLKQQIADELERTQEPLDH